MKRLSDITKALPIPIKRFLRPIWRACLRPIKNIGVVIGNYKAPNKFLSLKGRKDLKLNLGCGDRVKPSWVNIDISIPNPMEAVFIAHPNTVIISHNLCKSLPIDNESCDYIYSSHFFEHLECKDGIKLMKRCFEKLKQGGVFRIALPNFRLVFQAYISGDCSMWDLVDQYVDEMMPGIGKTALDYLNLAIYQLGEHKCIYDEERIISILKKIGFRSAAVSLYKKEIDEDVATHRKYSFYVEAVK